MQCKNCGAAFSDDSLLCPYCGYENEAEAIRQQEAALTGIYAKIAHLFHLPERAAQKASRWILLGGTGLLACFIILLLLVFGGSRLVTGTALSRQNARLEALEELYAAGDYEEMCALLDKIDGTYADTYGKYTTVGEIYRRLSDLKESSRESTEFVAGFPEGYDLLSYELQWSFDLLARCEAQRQAGYVYGEGPGVETLEGEILALLQNTLLLTTDEITEGLAIYRAEGDLLPLCRQSALRLSGGVQ